MRFSVRVMCARAAGCVMSREVRCHQYCVCVCVLKLYIFLHLTTFYVFSKKSALLSGENIILSPASGVV